MASKSIIRFYLAIGIFYLLNLFGLLPFASKDMLVMMYPTVLDNPSGEHFRLLQDAWMVVGMQLGAVGLAALWSIRDPVRYIGIIPTVVAIELLDAIWDLYSILYRGEALWFGLITFFIHFVWIAWGLSVLRNAPTQLKN